MKILHAITLSELGGAQSVMLNLIEKSITDGHEVWVTSSVGGALWNELPPSVVKRTISQLQHRISIWKDIQVIYELYKIYRKFKPDVIHLHSSKIGLLGRIAFPTKKIIYTVHGFDSIRIAHRKFLYLEKLLQYKARHIVAVSNYDANNLQNEGIQHNLSCIYNGIPDFSEKVKGIPEENAFLRARSVIEEGEKFRVICIARLAAPKRFDIFCKAAEILVNDNISFYWVGNKKPVTDVPTNVKCLGEIPNAHQLLPYTQIFMLPSDYEGMPMSILESLSYGVPVVASAVGGIGEVLDSKNGFAVQNSGEEFAHHIRLYKNDQALCRRAKREAIDSYRSKFTVSKMYQEYFTLYTSVSLGQ
ncbi:glycosyltransferase [Dyadobacter sp. CY312]|uniref:glycosyltransferase n=1 Tax=Dyadobacter sp. CY312 TaxID=2907303 RepID=UPI001F448C6F|nr:glycosyltransferase [Dyadobacter sp. CY312]MCE7041267.1 glycosyltransferase [Dyadobacter sp. CY312]